jgi:hypothetical protein
MQSEINGLQDEDLEKLSSEDAQRILQVGEHASQLLRTPVYNLAYRNVMDSLFNDWLGSKPKEELLRASLYNQAIGLTTVTERLASAVADAELVLQKQQAQNDPEQHQQEYLDNQGFTTQ